MLCVVSTSHAVLLIIAGEFITGFYSITWWVQLMSVKNMEEVLLRA